MTTMIEQRNTKTLNKRWELVTVDRLGIGMFGMDDEMKQIDLRDKTRIVFGDGEHSDSILYKVVDQEIKLFGKNENQLSQELIWRIEYLTRDELHLLFIARADKKELIRLKYRTRD